MVFEEFDSPDQKAKRYTNWTANLIVPSSYSLSDVHYSIRVSNGTAISG